MFNLILSSMNSERLESSERRFIVLANSNPLRANTFTSTINKAGAWFSSQCMSDLAWPGNKLNLLKMPSLSQHQALGALLISLLLLFLPGPWTTISPSTRHQDVMIERRMNESCWELERGSIRSSPRNGWPTGLVSVSALSPWDELGLGWGWALGFFGLRVWGQGLTIMLSTV